ncbi:TBC domain-containing protein [Cryptosporidium canis]|uniref:TBC domain-containing protein n=1 Tax=Cryptosporidium canis TaxID=195482 RepID=A0ABQ8PC69_9CRYT|nr:TBC domain-containing protein [Cryptosporidium canis]
MNRRFIWCMLLKINVDDINRRIILHDLVRSADKTLVKQVNCDVDRCNLPNDALKTKLKHLIISVFSYRKEHFSYIQGIHEIGRVFLTLFHEHKQNILDIKKSTFKLTQFSDNNETIALSKALNMKLSTGKGRMDICFKAFDKFLMAYSTPYIYKHYCLTEINMESTLSKIASDVLHLLNHDSPTLHHFFINLKEKNESESKIFMFILPWIITYFSHNVSMRSDKLLYYIFDHVISNHPLLIIFLVKEILIQCQWELFDFLEKYFGSETHGSSEHEIYPFVHLYFQNLDISSLKWNAIIDNSHKSLSNSRLSKLNSYDLWNIDNKCTQNFKVNLIFRIRASQNTMIYSTLIFTIFSIAISFFVNEFGFSKVIRHVYS